MNKRQLLAASIVTTFLTVAGVGTAAESGMKGMMENCPMMGGASDVLNPQQQMQMRAEMMEAMGQIMQKYADQAQPAAK
jgi:hypothetical protein